MAARHIGLGRGLNALIKDSSSPSDSGEAGDGGGIQSVPLERVRENPWQPRRRFDPSALEELVQSIRAHGVLQPLLVRDGEEQGTYQLIAGERRFRAAREAAVERVPVIVLEVGNQQALELALIENLQREDLNVVEEAQGYRALAEDFDLTQEQIAERVGKPRATVANCLRLLALPEALLELLRTNQLTPGHGKVLLSLDQPEEQERLGKKAVREGCSVRTLESWVQHDREDTGGKKKKKKRAEKSDIPRDHLHFLSERLAQHFSTSVHLSPCKTLANGKKAKGSVSIDFYSNEELDHILDLLGLADQL